MESLIIIKMWKIKIRSLKKVIIKSLAKSNLIYVISSPHEPRSEVIKIYNVISTVFYCMVVLRKLKWKLFKSLLERWNASPKFWITAVILSYYVSEKISVKKDYKWNHVSKAFFPLFDSHDLNMRRCEFKFLHLNASFF